MHSEEVKWLTDSSDGRNKCWHMAPPRLKKIACKFLKGHKFNGNWVTHWNKNYLFWKEPSVTVELTLNQKHLNNITRIANKWFHVIFQPWYYAGYIPRNTKNLRKPNLLDMLGLTHYCHVIKFGLIWSMEIGEWYM